MTYKKVILDESILDFDSWLPQEAIDALTEIVYDKADEFVNQEKNKSLPKRYFEGWK